MSRQPVRAAPRSARPEPATAFDTIRPPFRVVGHLVNFAVRGRHNLAGSGGMDDAALERRLFRPPSFETKLARALPDLEPVELKHRGVTLQLRNRCGGNRLSPFAW